LRRVSGRLRRVAASWPQPTQPMSDKLRQLTDQIYREGIEKANEESERLLASARAEAERIRAEATADAERAREEARKDAAAMRRQVGAEVALAARKATGQLRQDLRRLLAEDVLAEPLRKGLRDPEVLGAVLSACAGALKAGADGAWTIELDPEARRRVEAAITAGKHEALGAGVTLRDAEGQPYGFTVRPEGERYALSFDDRAFAEFLGRFLRVETREVLGGDFLGPS
jgi:V/A-type H+-transporting ATPase subunit E